MFDIGINNDADTFLAALDEHRPDFLGMSALLTTTMPYMKVVIDALKERGLRDEYMVLVRRRAAQRSLRRERGRGRVLPRCGRVAVETAKEMMSARRQHAPPMMAAG